MRGVLYRPQFYTIRIDKLRFAKPERVYPLCLEMPDGKFKITEKKPACHCKILRMCRNFSQKYFMEKSKYCN